VAALTRLIHQLLKAISGNETKIEKTNAAKAAGNAPTQR
jgi:hypothetical protein